MPRVLLVEDEAMLRDSMARAIAKVPTYSVEAVATVGEAVASIQMNPPDILVSDIDLPDGSGIELLSVLKKQKRDIPVLFVSAYLADFRGDIPSDSGISLLEKPFEVEQLRDKIRMALQGRAVDLKEEFSIPMSALGYVELASLGKHSIRICVVESAIFGEIIIKDGAIWAAQDWEGVGEAAFMRLIFQRDITCVLYDKDLPRNVFRGQEMLQLARLQQDGESPETQGVAHPPKSRPKSALGLVNKGEEEAFAEVWELAIEALLSKDYARAERAFSQALRLKPEHPGARANIERLRELGYPKNEEKNELG